MNRVADGRVPVAALGIFGYATIGVLALFKRKALVLAAALAGLAWSRWGWDGVCLLALGMIALAGARHLTGYSRKHGEPMVKVAVGQQEPV